MRKSIYSSYVLALLTSVYTFSQVDQSVLGVVLQPIQNDLHLSDGQLGFAIGTAFGVFYATLGLPFGRWADRGDRSTISAFAIGIWGVAVLFFPFVTSFWQLVLERIAAGIGAAACMPPTYSLLGDYFPKADERMRAMTLYTMANPMGALGGSLLGGWLNEYRGWRFAFVIIGIPGLVLAVLLKLTVAETRIRGHLPPKERKPSLSKVFKTMWHQRSSRHLAIAITLLFTAGWGLTPWYAACLIRSHGMGSLEVGAWLGGVSGVGGAAGILLGGYLSNRIFLGNERGQMRLTALLQASNVAWLGLFLLLRGKFESLAALGLCFAAFCSFYGPAFTLLQRVATADMRATQVGIVMMLANLLGLAVGAEAVGLLSDLLQPLAGTNSLRYAMVAVSPLYVGAAYHFWKAGQTAKADLLAVAEVGNLHFRTGCAEQMTLPVAP